MADELVSTRQGIEQPDGQIYSPEFVAQLRERDLQCIADNIEYWLKWVERERTDEGLTTEPDTHIMLSYENAPPVWPTVGQLKRWLAVLRNK